MFTSLSSEESRVNRMDAAFWQRIRDNNFAVPEGCDPADLTPELVGYLASPDPTLRDAFGYAILGYWIERGVYDDDHLRGLAMQMVSNLAVGLDEPGTDAVFGRAFSALVLSEIIMRDNAQPFFVKREVQNVLRWALEYFAAERDLRAFVDGKGWAHALAYAADLFRALVRSRHLTPEDIEQVLNAIADKVTLPDGVVYAHNEDERLALVVWAALQRGGLSLDFLVMWLARCVRVMSLEDGDGRFNFSTHAARQNTRNFLRSVYFRVVFAKKAPELGRELRPKLLAAIKAVNA